MNYTQIKEKLQEFNISPEAIGNTVRNGEGGQRYYRNKEYTEKNVINESNKKYFDYDEKYNEYFFEVEKAIIENIGEYDIADQSYFHDGYPCHVVLFFKEHNVYLKVDGYFSSYDETQWDGMSEVFPQEKVITVFNAK